MKLSGGQSASATRNMNTRHYASRVTGFFIIPGPSSSLLSPALRRTGGLRTMPTPEGVSVKNASRFQCDQLRNVNDHRSSRFLTDATNYHNLTGSAATCRSVQRASPSPCSRCRVNTTGGGTRNLPFSRGGGRCQRSWCRILRGSRRSRRFRANRVLGWRAGGARTTQDP